MNPVERKREKEKRIVTDMIRIYCRGRHQKKDGLCPECRELDTYVRLRTDKCLRMETKTFCSLCETHCYRPDMRERITGVMRYSGPRMLLRHPVGAFSHFCRTMAEKARRKRG